MASRQTFNGVDGTSGRGIGRPSYTRWPSSGSMRAAAMLSSYQASFTTLIVSPHSGFSGPAWSSTDVAAKSCDFFLGGQFVTCGGGLLLSRDCVLLLLLLPALFSPPPLFSSSDSVLESSTITSLACPTLLEPMRLFFLAGPSSPTPPPLWPPIWPFSFFSFFSTSLVHNFRLLNSNSALCFVATFPSTSLALVMS